MLDFDQIRDLIELVADRKLQGVEIERSGFRIRIEGPVTAGTAQVVEITPQPAVAAAVAQASGAAPSEEPQSALPADARVIKSPIVGTFYTAPSPDSDPYVRVGDRISAGDVLCIVEAMKLMNEIEADSGGVILEIYPKNAQAVEFGEPLFAVQSD